MALSGALASFTRRTWDGGFPTNSGIEKSNALRRECNTTREVVTCLVCGLKHQVLVELNVLSSVKVQKKFKTVQTNMVA